MKSVETKSLEAGAYARARARKAFCVRYACASAARPPPPIFPREESRAVWGRSDGDLAFAREQLSIVGDELARRAIDTRKPVATNKLKHTSGGQIACKLVAVPLIARGGPAGALIIFNRPEEPSFDEFTVRRLGRFARLLARNATQDLDSLTGLLSWDGFKTRVDSWQRNAHAGRHGVDVVRRHRSPASHQRSRRLLRWRSRDRALRRRDPPRTGRRREFRVPSVGRPLHGVPAAHESCAGTPARREHLPGSEHRRRVEEGAQPPGVDVVGRGVHRRLPTCISIIASPRRRSPARPPRIAAAAASRSTRTPTRA